MNALHPRSVVRALRAAADVLEADCDLQPDESAPVETNVGSAEPRKPRKAERPPYRPEGPVDEVSAKRAQNLLRRAGVVSTPRKR